MRNRTDVDLANMSEAEQAQYFEDNAHRFTEIFDLEHPVPVEIVEPIGVTITVRLKPAELDVLSNAAQARGKKLSTFVREAALAIADQPAAKALPSDEKALKAKFEDVIQNINGIATLVGAR